VGNTMDILSLQPSSNDAAVQKKLAEYRSHMDKWNGEIAEEQEKALDLEHEVDRAERRAARYDLGEALLEISVVLSSITLLTRRRRYFVLGVLFGLVGVIAAATALVVH
jgi:hypothetical protein